ncbi:hypothetical protein F5X68DRAFT_188876 [Plectosphaerella plurivora]|uniref:Uncharacterized protein n=1 Tax=Plectosphaerella plurivora TaxID=936078 RepID=A0A9P8VFT5_9PEZI|nr:hypothetical protein F5X68DRAFT_188876 [Plectosphaerella plurivora]
MSSVLQANTDDSSTQDPGVVPLDGELNSSDTAVSSSSPPSAQTTLNGNDSPRISDLGGLSSTSLWDEELPPQPGDENFSYGYIRVRTPEPPRPCAKEPYRTQAVPAIIMLPPKKPFRMPYPDKPFCEWPVAPRRHDGMEENDESIRLPSLFPSSSKDWQPFAAEPEPEPEPDEINMSDDFESDEEEDTRIAKELLRRRVCSSPAPSEETEMTRKQYQRTRKLEVKRSHRAQDARMKQARELYETQRHD